MFFFSFFWGEFRKKNVLDFFCLEFRKNRKWEYDEDITHNSGMYHTLYIYIYIFIMMIGYGWLRKSSN